MNFPLISCYGANITINDVGGFFPVALAISFLYAKRMPLWPFLVGIVLTMLNSQICAGGVQVNVLMVSLFIGIFSTTWYEAFTTGVFSVLIGSDMATLPNLLSFTAKLHKHGGAELTIGGGGFHDAILVVGLISALVSQALAQRIWKR